jgi:hypothetical protein
MTNEYLRGLQTLKNCLPIEARSEFHTLEDRLLDNLRREQLYGSTETTRADKSAIIYALNDLAQRYCGSSFNDLMNPSRTIRAVSISSPMSSETNTQKNGKGALASYTLPQVTIELLTSILPTAYCHFLDVKEFPLVTLVIDNTGPECDDVSLQFTMYIEGYSDRSIDNVEVSKGHKTSASLIPLFQPPAIKDLNDIRVVTLHIILDYSKPIQRRKLLSLRLRIHARNVALLAFEKADNFVFDLTRYLAAWVTPNRPEIDKLRRKALEYHAQRKLVRLDYTDNTPSETANIIREIARAFFLALRHEVNLVYIDTSFTPKRDDKQMTQRVYLPTETLTRGGANCIDGVVLFASLLESMNIGPFIILVPGHAFVGWRIHKDVEQYEFLDTTLIGQEDFEAAQQHARIMFDEAQRQGSFDRGPLEPDGFARLINVAQCRRDGIDPLE